MKTHVVWKPFQLNPTMPKDGMDRTAYLDAKFGSLDTFKGMEERLLEAGSIEQIPFAFEKIARTPNTVLAHRLIWQAGMQGRQDAVVEQLFKGYFEEGLDIGASSVLIELANRAGLNVANFLKVMRASQKSRPKNPSATGWAFEECHTSSSINLCDLRCTAC